MQPLEKGHRAAAVLLETMERTLLLMIRKKTLARRRRRQSSCKAVGKAFRDGFRRGSPSGSPHGVFSGHFLCSCSSWSSVAVAATCAFAAARNGVTSKQTLSFQSPSSSSSHRHLAEPDAQATTLQPQRASRRESAAPALQKSKAVSFCPCERLVKKYLKAPAGRYAPRSQVFAYGGPR